MFNILTFVGFHTWLSLVALASGVILVVGLLEGRAAPRWAALFFVTAIATNVTGFMFPFTALLPSHIVDIISSVVLLITLFARYARHFAGAWRWVYAVGVVITTYFLVFVAIAQIFAKVPALASPTQTNFAIAQAMLLLIAIIVGIKAVKKFHPAPGT
ncbi:MAG TPA: hypothetical protein VGO34_13255 [Alphaproteobacteria bacterium]|jgi:hypothetical protein